MLEVLVSNLLELFMKDVKNKYYDCLLYIKISIRIYNTLNDYSISLCYTLYLIMLWFGCDQWKQNEYYECLLRIIVSFLPQEKVKFLFGISYS